MDAIGAVGLPKIESWMVDLLFSPPGEAEAAAPPAAVPSVAVGSSARSSVAGATGQAIASLQAGGVAPPDGETSDRNELTVRQLRDNISSNNAMTSAQISAALYSGVGIPRGDNRNQQANDTFDTAILEDIFINQITIDHAYDASMSGDSVTPAEWQAHGEAAIAKDLSMQKAFDAHQLVFQKLSDIPGLNYTGNPTYGGYLDSAPTSGSITATYDVQVMKDLLSNVTQGRHGSTMGIGGVGLFVTWTDASLHENK